jgi:hypothetical protein
LKEADVSTMVATLETKGFLGERMFVPDFFENLSKRLFWVHNCFSFEGKNKILPL